MNDHDLIRRAEDLASRSLRTNSLTNTNFLSPAERYKLEQWKKTQPGLKFCFFGGHSECERSVGFFLPDYIEEEWMDWSEHICAFELTASFGAPGHRDYMGALLGMGIGREWLGDIWVKDNKAVVFCLPSVESHLLSIDKVGRFTVKAKKISLSEITAPERQVKEKAFTVQSLRLDAVVAGLFGLSRTEAARQITAGNVSVNYSETDKTGLPVHEGDILSLRGKGKGKVTGFGGESKRGRQYVYTEKYI